MLFHSRIKAKWSLQTNTATAPFAARADDGMDYVVKKFDLGGPLRATETICTLIAEAVGVPTAPHRILEDFDGELVFGSQIYGDTSPSHAAMLSDDPPSTLALGQISRITSLDLFVGNDDRHLNNYLVRDQNGVSRIIAMDFSHTLLSHWPLPPLPLAETCKTIARGRHLRARWGFDVAEAKDCAERLRLLSPEFASQMVKQIPASWLPGTLADDFSAWWSSKQRLDRAEQIEAGVQDGSLL